MSDHAVAAPPDEIVFDAPVRCPFCQLSLSSTTAIADHWAASHALDAGGGDDHEAEATSLEEDDAGGDIMQRRRWGIRLARLPSPAATIRRVTARLEAVSISGTPVGGAFSNAACACPVCVAAFGSHRELVSHWREEPGTCGRWLRLALDQERSGVAIDQDASLLVVGDDGPRDSAAAPNSLEADDDDDSGDAAAGDDDVLSRSDQLTFTCLFCSARIPAAPPSGGGGGGAAISSHESPRQQQEDGGAWGDFDVAFISAPASHMMAVHGFSLQSQVMDAYVDEYDRIKLINYLRKCYAEKRCPRSGRIFSLHADWAAHVRETRSHLPDSVPEGDAYLQPAATAAGSGGDVLLEVVMSDPSSEEEAIPMVATLAEWANAQRRGASSSSTSAADKVTS